jgi:membrane protein implicated in regulation of membrane protease activity
VVTEALPIAVAPTYRRRLTTKETSMLWLIIGIVLLIVAVAGGAIIHPILFALAILALVAFFAGSRGRAV